MIFKVLEGGEGDNLQKSTASRSKSNNQADAFRLGATTRCPPRCLPLAQSARIHGQRLNCPNLVLSNRTILTLSCRHPIFVKKALVDAEMELGKKCFLRVGPERGAADPAQTILLAANHETMEVKVAPIECDLEQLVQRGDAAVTADVQTPPNGWVNLEEQNVEGSVQKIQQKKGGSW